jgi:hypothetical protein
MVYLDLLDAVAGDGLLAAKAGHPRIESLERTVKRIYFPDGAAHLP